MSTDPADESRELEDWSRRLSQALQILDLTVDHRLLLELATDTSAALTPSAGAISTFLVGYAAGSAATTGSTGSSEAVRDAVRIAHQSIEPGSPDAGWADTAQ